MLIACLLSASLLMAGTLTFDDVATLSQYDALGVHFQYMGFWNASGTSSVTVDPSGGAYSLPNGIYNLSWTAQAGIVTFDFALSSVSIYALSGPGTDNLIAGTKIRAYDASNALLGEAAASSTIQFQLLTINATGIRKLELIVGGNHDVWDQLVYCPVPELNSLVLLLLAMVSMMIYRKIA